MELNVYTYKGKDFYLLDELKEYDPKFFYGCAQKGPEKIIEKKNILDFEVVKYTKKDGDYNWSESTFNYKRSKLLVGLRWAADNIPKLCGKIGGYKYEDAPPLLELTEEECFKDKNGRKLDVEVRGERSEDKVVFKAKDIARIFEMDNLNIVIVEKKSFVKGEDYHVYSINNRLTNGESSTNGSKPCIFLTYNGLLKVVFESRSGIAKTFRSWATKVIYTAGTPIQREEVSKTILRADSKCVKTVLSKSVHTTPCIYLFSLGKVKDLRKLEYFKEALKNASGGTVYKWGRTIDLKRRTGEHNITYGSIEGVTLVLEILTTREKYNDLQNQYGGCLKDLVDKNNLQSQEIKELKYELTIKNKDIELKNKDIELLEKDVKLERERSKSSLLEKEVEILNLKLQLTLI